MRCSKTIGCAVALLALRLTTPASAVPLLTDSQTLLGGGLVAVEVSVDASDGAMASLAIAITFTGTFNQIQAFGSINVDDDGDADTFAAIPAANYSSAFDSFFLTSGGAVAPWIQPLPPFNGAQGGAPGSTTYQFSAGTGPGSMLEVAPLAQLVVPVGSLINYDGSVARLGEDLPLSGSIQAIPEPSTGLLAGLGMVGVGLASRRTQRSGEVTGAKA